MSTLLLTAYTPTLSSGTGVRTYGVVAALARLGPVEVAYRPFDGDRPSGRYDGLDGVTMRPLPMSRGPARALAYGVARLRGTPDELARGAAPELTAQARAAPGDVRVVADGPQVAAALLGVARRRPVVYCAHNLESAFRPGLPGERASRRALERFERRVLATMAESWMVSRADLDGAAALCPGARLRLVPNVVDTEAIAPVTPRADARRVLFVADLTYAPNRAGLAFLRDEVLPALRRRVPDAEVVVAGRGGAPADGADGLRVLGFVDDLHALYASAGAVAVPLLQGGGSPLKFVEALAHGLPVVATPTAAAGLDVVAGEHYLEAADGESFAAALALALAQGATGIAARGRALACERYSIDALCEVLGA